MIAIVESGSTKSEWVILDILGNPIDRIRSRGFNPYFHSSDDISDGLQAEKALMDHAESVNKLFFYGAGCSSSALQSIVRNGLTSIFSNADIAVEHDLLAAVYALYEDEPLICGILGTGSNSCYYDGQKVLDVLPSLGFILGDEASGSYFGKKLLTDYFYERLPANMTWDFRANFELGWDGALENIYRNENANVYLASFMPFLAKHKDTQYVQHMVKGGMNQFIKTHILVYPDYKECQIGFVGSVAHIFRDILQECIEDHKLRLGKILRNPIDELVDFHVGKLKQEVL